MISGVFDFLLLKTYTKLYQLWKQHRKQCKEQLISLIDPTCPEACFLTRNVGNDLIKIHTVDIAGNFNKLKVISIRITS